GSYQTKRHLAVLLDRVHFVPFERGMDINFTVFINKAHRDGIGVTLVARHRQNTVGSGFEQFFGIFFGHQPLFYPLFSKHFTFSFQPTLAAENILSVCFRSPACSGEVSAGSCFNKSSAARRTVTSISVSRRMSARCSAGSPC